MKLIKWMSLLVLSFFSSYSYSDIGDGPRAYLPPPIDSNIFSIYGVKVSGNSSIDSSIVNPNLNIDLDLLIAQYSRTMKIADKYMSFTLIQPFGKLKSSVKLPETQELQLDSSSVGIGDTQLLASIGVYNLPPLTIQQYQTYKPTIAIGALSKITVPTGSYDKNKLTNLGANRYSIQFSIPITFAFAETFLDPKFTSIDLLPSITFFTENSSPYKAKMTDQKSIFKFESHVTHNVNAALWGSFDFLYTYGGETIKNHTDQHNKQRSLGIGATVGMQFSKQLGLKISYGGIVERNDKGLDGNFTRIVFTYIQF